MLSENLFALRRKSGLSQEELAEKISVSRQAISKWETGLSTPDLERLVALSECFGVTVDELIGTKPAAGPQPADESLPAQGRQGGLEPQKGGPQFSEQGRLGVFLCAAGAVCLLLFGLLSLVRPAFAQQVSESSMVTLNGSGILIALFLLLMAQGIALIFKKK